MNKLKIPKNERSQKQEKILEINDNIKVILNEILNTQVETISSKNEDEIKQILDKADWLILECHATNEFKISRNTDFSRLVYEYQRLKLKYESYQINLQINLIHDDYNRIKTQQEEIETNANNLVYNILGFIASFSVISASVEAISEIKETSNIILFMAFTSFILLTTLIGLHNFYKIDYYPRGRLQNNYFLWKAMIIVMVTILGYQGLKYTRENQDYIFEKIGEGIGKTINIVGGNANNKNDKTSD